MIAVELLFSKTDELVKEIQEKVVFLASEKERADTAERLIFDATLKIGRELMSAYFACVGNGDVGETCEHDGQVLKRQSEAHKRTYVSIFGALEVTRAVYAKRARKKLHAPLDKDLGFPRGEHSYVVRDFVQRMGVQVAFDKAVEFMEKTFSLGLGKLMVEKTNQAFGDHIEETRAEEIVGELAEEDEELLVVSVDGKGVPMSCTSQETRGVPETPQQKHMRKKREARTGQSDFRLPPGHGTKKKQMAWLGVVYSTASYARTPADILEELSKKKDPHRKHEKRHPNRPKPKNKRIRARMTDYFEGQAVNGQDEVFQHVTEQVHNRLKKNDMKVLCLMDGQKSLWERQASLLPEAIPILDIFHASEYVWKAAYCFHPQGSNEADRFFELNLERLLTGNVSAFIRSLRAKMASLKSKRKKDIVRSVITYCENHKAMMKYDEYLAAGYPIGSGVIEGGCRHLVGDRMTLTGMRWKIDGAQAMLHTRATFINGDWDSLFEQHIQREQAELYGQAA